MSLFRRFVASLLLGLALLNAGCAAVSRQGELLVSDHVSNTCPTGSDGRELAGRKDAVEAYIACVGSIVITDEEGADLAKLTYTAYVVPHRHVADRPIVFIWNGGPGADSRLLQFHALGPRVLRDGALVDNPVTPLDVADLVFLDPAGTGFSRPVSDAAATKIYSTMGDIAATARFVEQFRAAAGRTASPVYLAGESFGTWRAAGVADALIDRGIPVAGILLISGGIPLGEEADRATLRALSLPNRTATALALNRLAPELQSDHRSAISQSEVWARDVWLPALRDQAALDDAEREKVVEGLSRYSGISEAAIDPQSLWISPRDFRTGLLADEGRVLGIFDMRKTDGAAGEAVGNAAIIAFYRETLGHLGGSYAGIESDAILVGSLWQYDQAPITKESLARAIAGEGPPSPSRPWVREVLQKSPELRIYVATGLYDSLNACAANDAIIGSLDPALSVRIESHCYRGGHMMYEDPAVAQLFGNDIRAFLRNSRAGS